LSWAVAGAEVAEAVVEVEEEEEEEEGGLSG
jgi:hypothetical protein